MTGERHARKQPKSEAFIFRCTPDEATAIREAAERRGLTISAYILGRVLKDVHQPTITVNGVRVQ